MMWRPTPKAPDEGSTFQGWTTDRYGSEDHDTCRLTCMGVPEIEIHEDTWLSSYVRLYTHRCRCVEIQSTISCHCFFLRHRFQVCSFTKLIPGKLRKDDDFMEHVTWFCLTALHFVSPAEIPTSRLPSIMYCTDRRGLSTICGWARSINWFRVVIFPQNLYSRHLPYLRKLQVPNWPGKPSKWLYACEDDKHARDWMHDLSSLSLSRWRSWRERCSIVFIFAANETTDLSHQSTVYIRSTGQAPYPCTAPSSLKCLHLVLEPEQGRSLLVQPTRYRFTIWSSTSEHSDRGPLSRRQASWSEWWDLIDTAFVAFL